MLQKQDYGPGNPDRVACHLESPEKSAQLVQKYCLQKYIPPNIITAPDFLEVHSIGKLKKSTCEEDQNAKSLHFCYASQHTYKRVFRGGDGNELRSGKRFPLQRVESRSKSIISLTHIECVRHSGHCSPIRKTDDLPPPIRMTQD